MNSDTDKDVFISEEYNRFTEKVETINSILKGMRSEDPDVAEFNTLRAERYLRELKECDKDIEESLLKVKNERTLINTKEALPEDREHASLNAFMANVERDAKERSENRRMRKEVSDRYKKEGNKAFREKKYEKAVLLYTKAIDETCDSALLYNNRALTYLKLNLYKRAIQDTESALKINKNSSKAKIYKAQALFMLDENKESKKLVEELTNEHPGQAKFFKEFQESWTKETNKNNTERELGIEVEEQSSQKEIPVKLALSPSTEESSRDSPVIDKFVYETVGSGDVDSSKDFVFKTDSESSEDGFISL